MRKAVILLELPCKSTVVEEVDLGGRDGRGRTKGMRKEDG